MSCTTSRSTFRSGAPAENEPISLQGPRAGLINGSSTSVPGTLIADSEGLAQMRMRLRGARPDPSGSELVMMVLRAGR